MNRLFSEAIKCKDGILYNLEYHQQRVDRTLKQFYGTQIDLQSLREQARDTQRQGLYKLRMIYNERMHSIEFVPYSFRKIDKVRVVIDNNIEYQYKYDDRSRLNELLEKSGSDDIIIIKNDRVTDSFSSNLIFRSTSGELHTPEHCLLRGSKRESLLEKGIIKEVEIGMKDIKNYTQILFINAMIDIEDDVKIDVSSLIYP